MCSAYDVTIVPFRTSEMPAKLAAMHPSSYRWILVRDWMKATAAAAPHGGHAPFDAVLFTDVRDTVFQDDPFRFLDKAASAGGKGKGGGYSPAFYAFLEAKPGTIVSRAWVDLSARPRLVQRDHRSHRPRFACRMHRTHHGAGRLRLEQRVGEGLLWAGRPGAGVPRDHQLQRHEHGDVAGGVRLRRPA